MINSLVNCCSQQPGCRRRTAISLSILDSNTSNNGVENKMGQLPRVDFHVPVNPTDVKEGGIVEGTAASKDYGRTRCDCGRRRCPPMSCGCSGATLSVHPLRLRSSAAGRQSEQLTTVDVKTMVTTVGRLYAEFLPEPEHSLCPMEMHSDLLPRKLGEIDTKSIRAKSDTRWISGVFDRCLGRSATWRESAGCARECSVPIPGNPSRGSLRRCSGSSRKTL
ncbi:hypothetical protein LSAT2_026908 [Lamellibrachia satsuma]|nr:hypothetical protein LSAT2_026908 [Lamellibrachia satsuma]